MKRRPGEVKLGPDFNPGEARWCLTHTRLECTKNRTKGNGNCHAASIRGTNACLNHSGSTKELAMVKGQSRITAWSAVGAPPDGKTLDAGMAVLGMLHMSWLRAAAYGDLLRRQVINQPPDPDGSEGIDADGEVKPDGLIGFRYGAAGKDGTIFATNEEARGLVKLESEERDRVVRFAKTAHDMGISSRLTALAERWGDVVITQIMLVMDSLNLTAEQEARVPGLIQAHLGSIDVDAMNPHD